MTHFLDAARDETLSAITAHAEQLLAAQNRFADTQDARASQIAVAGASLTAAAVALGATSPAPALVAAAVAGGCMTFAAAALAFWASRSEPFYPPGWRPKDFAGDIAANKSDREIRLDHCKTLQHRLAHNDPILTRRGRRANFAALALVLAPLVAAAAAVATKLLP